MIVLFNIFCSKLPVEVQSYVDFWTNSEVNNFGKKEKKVLLTQHV